MSAFYHPILESEEFKAIRKEWLEKQLGDWMPFNNDEYSGADKYNWLIEHLSKWQVLL